LPLPAGTESARCGTCLRDAPAYGYTVAACDYTAPLDQLVLGLKFGRQLALAPAFAALMRDAVVRQGQQALPDMLCAVPLGEQRLAQRGYNQAWEIAKPLAKHLGIGLAPKLLQRTRETGAQTALHPDQRQKNVRHAFLTTSDDLQGKHVGVVDDVMTTGATLQEIALELKRQGAAEVTNYIFARTPPH
jgi:ComF family protein